MDLFTKRSLYHDTPPHSYSRNEVNPTLLVSWWCTIFSVTIILIRLFGRWIRTERLFLEDKIMFWSMIPLFIRMALVHVVLIWGTNNTTLEGLSHQEILHRETGSKLVLAARIFYAAFIWIAKLTVLEFLKRTIGASWAKSYETGLRMIYGFLIVTFIGVVIGTLSECQPFRHYWQVVPDPGPSCREGIVQLLTMGICDIVTDIVLIIFPIPVILASKAMTLLKKLSLICLFLLSIILIAITAYRIPSTISKKSAQQYRSLIASLEILAATGVANVVIIGSFIRDKGVKKAKFKAPSVGDESVLTKAPTRSMSIALNHWGSDEDLIRDMGVSLPPLLRRNTNQQFAPRPAQAAPPGQLDSIEEGRKDSASKIDKKWNFKRGSESRQRRGSDSSVSSTSTDIKLRDLRQVLDEPGSPAEAPEPLLKQMSFFDVGGLVENPTGSPANTSREASIRDVPAPAGRGRAGSKAFLTDIGGLLSRHKEEEEPTAASSRSLTPMKAPERRKFSRSPRPSKVLDFEPKPEKKEEGPDSLNISDAGGLLRL